MAQTRIYSDLDIAFSKHPITKDVTKKIKDNAIIASVKNIVSTNKGERPFNPNFGSNIRALLFEPMDRITVNTLEKEIELSIKNFEPRVEVVSIVAQPNYALNNYKITLHFVIKNSLTPIKTTIYLSRLR
jgi:hypothetical protein